jgi:DNA-binding MarR family transcriptional regulator
MALVCGSEDAGPRTLDWHTQPPGPRFSYVIARLDRAVRLAIEDCLQPFALTVPQFTALSVLLRRSGLSNAQPARRSYITPQSMHDVVLELERRSLVRRNVDPAHRKILRITVTPEGREVAACCEAAVVAIEDVMLADLYPGARERLIDELATRVHAPGG